MSFNRYYKEELSFLREMGREFAGAFPSVAPFLAARGSDPDVERTLEGVAFLTGRVRQKLDDEFPEIINGLFHLMFPHYLRPVPAMSIVGFQPIPGMVKDVQMVPKGTQMDSVPVEGTRCRFRSCYDTRVLPLSLASCRIETKTGNCQQLRLSLERIGTGTIGELNISSLRIHFWGDPGPMLYLWFCRNVRRCWIASTDHSSHGLELPPACVRPVGFDEGHAMIPYPLVSLDGYRILQEYFAFPEKFLFVDIEGFDRAAALKESSRVDLVVEFSTPFPDGAHITPEHFQLNCTPVINLKEMVSDPIRVSHHKTSYPIRPVCSEPDHFELYSVQNVTSRRQGSVELIEYPAFYSFAHEKTGAAGQRVFYYMDRIAGVTPGVSRSYVSFVNARHEAVVPPAEVVEMKMTCTNVKLGHRLQVGDIRVPTDSSPQFAQFRNISRVTPAVCPPFGGDLRWRLLSHLSLNHLSLSSVDALRGILSLYIFNKSGDFQTRKANQLKLDGIESIDSVPEERLYKGVPIRGVCTRLGLNEDCFGNQGELYLFSSVINEFLTQYISLNSFSRLTTKIVNTGERFQWEPRIGNKQII